MVTSLQPSDQARNFVQLLENIRFRSRWEVKASSATMQWKLCFHQISTYACYNVPSGPFLWSNGVLDWLLVHIASSEKVEIKKYIFITPSISRYLMFWTVDLSLKLPEHLLESNTVPHIVFRHFLCLPDHVKTGVVAARVVRASGHGDRCRYWRYWP